MTHIMGQRSVMISFRLSEEESRRVDKIIDDCIARNPHLKRANVYRELIGVIDTDLLTENDRRYLRGEMRPFTQVSAGRLPNANTSPTRDKKKAG